MCFVHAEGVVPGGRLLQRLAVDDGMSRALDTATSSLRAASRSGLRTPGVGLPDRLVGGGAPDEMRVLDGFQAPMHNRWNQDLAPAATVRQGEAIQLLCRDSLDIADAARDLTPEGILTLDLARVHPLSGPVFVEGAEPGDILEVEVLDIAPLVDFGYVVITPVMGLFGALGPSVMASLHALTEASELADPSPGRVPGALPVDQPSNLGAPFVQLVHFEKGQNTGFASFVGAETGRRARIPIAPFMGIYGVAPLRKGMYRTVPPNVSGGHGGNADVKQFTKGARIQFPVYVEGAKFSTGDGHMAQGDGESCVCAVETLMAVTVSFRVIKNTIIESPRAIVPAADPSQLAMTPEMISRGFYHTTGVGPDLMEDAKKATRDMIDWLVREERLSLHEAYAICSVAGDLKISECVDVPNWVVSMTVPRGIFES